MGFTLRQLEGHREFLLCLELQRETWGSSFAECVPPSILMLSQKLGGIAAGAFEEDGRLAGFVFGMSGIIDGKPAHWSHMLAVRPEYRDRGLGASLKLYQRDLTSKLGIELIYWTFDPLEAKNAHFNLNRLGAQIKEYIPDLYPGSESPLHRLGTDRLVAVWRPGDSARGSPHPSLGGPVVNSEASEGASPTPTDDGPLPDLPRLRIEIPGNVQALRERDPDQGNRWRASTRRAFLHYLSLGYSIIGFGCSDSRCCYLLECLQSRPPTPQSPGGAEFSP